jgi:hypothetical protein
VTDQIAYEVPPVEGPFTVVWEFTNPDIRNDGWHPHTRIVATESEAVNLWKNAQLYENTRPVSISPEPRWDRHSYDGRTPLTR